MLIPFLRYTMALLLLNTDVFAIAWELLGTDVSDVFSMALTSSSVHPVAIRWLLRIRPVYLRRAPHIRALHTDLRQPGQVKAQDKDCSTLLHIIASCGHLQCLTIAFQPASIQIITDPCFLYTITNIRSLKSFSIRSASFDGMALLTRFRTADCRPPIPCCSRAVVPSRHREHSGDTRA